MTDWLPPLILLEDHGHEWPTYLRVLHAVFRRDFVNRPLPDFRGRRMGVKRHPIVEGLEATFWHMISEGGQGDSEDDRIPDLRRCERIAWPRPIIEAADTARIKAWTTLRGGEERVILAVEDFSYVVVVALRRDYALPWTAYTVDKQHRRTKLQKEYDNFISSRS